jgi:hypothetical protein
VGSAPDTSSGSSQVTVTLRATLAGALKLSAAQEGDAQLRLLPRAP